MKAHLNICKKVLSSLHLVILLYPISILKAQENVGFQRLTNSQGLVHNKVRSVVQDTTGFIWIATMNGLQRYDGKNLLTFKHDPRNTNSISHNRLRALHADKKGGIWIGTRGGGLDYYINETFTHHYNAPEIPGTISDNEIECIAEDHNGNIWIGTRDGGLNKFADGVFTAYKFDPNDPNSISHNAIFSLLVDSQNRLWIGTYGGGLCMYENGKFTRFVHDPNDPSSIGSNLIISLLEGPDGALWIGSWQGGLSILKNGKFQNITKGMMGLNSNSIMSMVKHQGKIWLATWDGGLNYFENGHFKAYVHNVGDFKSISSNFQECLFVDNNGFIWIGTFSDGVNRFSTYDFTTFGHKPYQNSLGDGSVNDVIETSDGAVWVGILGGGLTHYKNGKFTIYRHDPSDPTSLSDKSNTIWAIAESENGDLWVATENGLDLFKNGQFKNYKFVTESNEKLSNIIYTMTCAKDGSLLLGSWNGDILKFKNGQFEKIYSVPTNLSANNAIESIEADADGSVWVASSEGRGIYHITDNGVKTIALTKNIAKSRTKIYTLYKSETTGVLWVGSMEGLYQYNPATEVLKRYDESTGICDNGISSITEDKHGNLWIGTFGGLSKFNPNTEKFVNFDEWDGLQGNQFTRNAAFYSHNSGYMYFGGTNGFSRFHPDSVQTNISNPQAVLTKLELSYKEVKPKAGTLLKQSIRHTEQIELSYKDDVFSIGYTALGKLKLNTASTFAYYLDGYEKDWNHVGDRTTATYSNIPAGDYTFKVKASNNDQDWGKVTQLKIRILPPWWETWWARILFFVTIISSIYGFVRRRIKHAERKRKELEELVKIRTRDLQEKTEKVEKQKEKILLQKEEITIQAEHLGQVNLQLEKTNADLVELNQEKDGLIEIVAHDLKSPLAACVGLMEITEISVDNKEETLGYIGKMKSTTLRLIDMISRILESNSLEIDGKDLNLEKVNLNHLLQEVGENFRILAEKKEIIIENLPDNIPHYFILADKNYLLQVYENLLSNAIKFSQKGQKVHIRIEQKHDRIKSMIIDNGPGIDKDQQHKLFKKYQKLNAQPTAGEHSTGLGLSIVKRFVEAMKGRIWCESVPGKGATFIVEFDVA